MTALEATKGPTPYPNINELCALFGQAKNPQAMRGLALATSVLDHQPDLATRLSLGTLPVPQSVFTHHPLTTAEKRSATAAFGRHFHQMRQAQNTEPLLLESARLLLSTGEPALHPLALGALNSLATREQNPALAAEALRLIPTNFFRNTYPECRRAFRQASQELADHFAKVQITSFVLSAHEQKPLTVDAVFVPAQKKPVNLVVVVAGTHGIEGFWGSAQQHWMVNEVIAKRISLDNTGLLLIHGYNAWGFNEDIRVLADGTDPNRNCLLENEPAFGADFNPGYAQLSGLLNPKTPYIHEKPMGFVAQCLWKILTTKGGKAALKQAVMMGQSTEPGGFSFTGTKHAPQLGLVQSLLEKHRPAYERVVVVDMHTGYGNRGHLTVINTNYTLSDSDQADYKRLFGEDIEFANLGLAFERQDTAKKQLVYPVIGSVFGFLGATKKPEQQTLGVAFEVGTASLGTLAQLESLHTLTRMCQFVRHGADSPTDELLLKSAINSLLNPRDLDWRAQAMLEGSGAFKRLFEALE